MIITPRQCKAARDLLGWKQKDLGEKAKIAVSTVADFEREKSQPIERTLYDLRKAFEDAGISFIDDKEQIGVTLSKKKKSKK